MSTWLTSTWFHLLEPYIRMTLALIFGFFIGLERTRKGKAAGIRTHILVCLGSCLVMVISESSTGQYRDPMRLAAQVVSGIGFLGGGVIWTDRKNMKRGLTTAANLWITSAVGLALGFGMYGVATFAGLLMALGMNMHDFAEKLKLIPPKEKRIELEHGDD